MLNSERPTCGGSARVLVIDDEPANLNLLERLLRRAGYPRVETTRDSDAALSLCRTFRPDLLILDIHMERVDGFEVLRRLRADLDGQELLPVLVLTADMDPATRRRAEALGADDFVLKPFAIRDLRERIESLLRMRAQWSALDELRYELWHRQRARAVDDASALRAVASVVHARADAASHPERVGELAGALARTLGLGAVEARAIERAAPLHDVGKLAVCDDVLEKPGPLTPPERAMTRRHTLLGAATLSVAESPLLQLAAEIALNHHERWDGRGYPRGLQGDQIPLSARIVAVADVFDALTHERAYKPAWGVGRALAELVAESGRQFDPRVVSAMLQLARVQPWLLQPDGSAGEPQSQLDPAVAAGTHLQRPGFVEDVVGRAGVA